MVAHLQHEPGSFGTECAAEGRSWDVPVTMLADGDLFTWPHVRCVLCACEPRLTRVEYQG